ncbi:MAG: MFS transporter [Pseudomonadota bacterium]|jgi:PAT family beta-lactamase induction signal transducer AmpG|nr:MFS transporter [Alphaproteobacteria bacterium]
MAMGFTSGIPFLLTLSTLSIWLTECGFNTEVIGMFTAVSLPYAFKFLWAPLVDRVHLPFFKGLHPIKRFGLCALICLIASLIVLAHLDPSKNIFHIVFVATAVSFFAATHDIVLDTLRIYASDLKQIGGGAASETVGFRIGMITSGAGAVYLSIIIGWHGAYLVMAACCISGIIGLLNMPDPSTKKEKTLAQKSWQSIFLNPLKDLLNLPVLVPLIGFILMIKITGTVINALGAPFLFSLGFSKFEYASITKVYGVGLMLLSGFIAGLIVHRRGIIFCLRLAITMQMLGSTLFALLAFLGQHHVDLLIVTLSIESFSSGLLATGFISYLSTFCKSPYVASHFTLLYSLGSLSRVLASIVGGYIAAQFGWVILFLTASMSLLPALWCLQKTVANKAKSR